MHDTTPSWRQLDDCRTTLQYPAIHGKMIYPPCAGDKLPQLDSICCRPSLEAGSQQHVAATGHHIGRVLYSWENSYDVGARRAAEQTRNGAAGPMPNCHPFLVSRLNRNNSAGWTRNLLAVLGRLDPRISIVQFVHLARPSFMARFEWRTKASTAPGVAATFECATHAPSTPGEPLTQCSEARGSRSFEFSDTTPYCNPWLTELLSSFDMLAPVRR